MDKNQVSNILRSTYPVSNLELNCNIVNVYLTIRFLLSAGIENLDEKDRRAILNEVKCLYEKEKQSKSNDGYSDLSAAADATKMASIEPPFTLASGNLQPGTEETMSNNSDRSEDSLLNDFEVLKSRGTAARRAK